MCAIQLFLEKNRVKQVFAILSIFCILLAGCQGNPSSEPELSDEEPSANPSIVISTEDNASGNAAPSASSSPRDANDPLVRKPSTLIYSKHARCRMACRHIDETEVAEILQKGRINYAKSEPAGRPDPKYALEGTTHDGQNVRIVFATAKKGTVVVTVIDLDTEWTCNCR
jgi:hypothetical protein